MRGLFRYRLVSLLIILCFFSSFIALYNGLFTALHTKRMIQKELQYNYQHTLSISITLKKQFALSVVEQVVTGLSDGNIFLENMKLYFEEIDGVFQPEVLIRQNENLMLPIKDIGFILTEGTIAAPQSRLKGIDQLSLHGHTIDHFVMIDTNDNPFAQDLFLLHINDYFKLVPNEMSKIDELTIRLSSNKADLYPSYLKISDNVKQIDADATVSVSEKITDDNIFRSLVSQESLIFVTLFLFALVNSTVISSYWITVRKKEIAIRKAFGASNIEVISILFFELWKIIGLAAITALVFQFVLQLSGNSTFELLDILWAGSIILFAITLAVSITLIIPIRHIKKLEPAEGVK